MVRIEHVGGSPGHARGKVPPHVSQHHDRTRGHVLAAMVAHALNDRAGSAVAHGKALSRPPRGKQPAAGGAIEDGIAEDDVPIGHAHQRPGRPDHDDAARHPFADIIVGFPLQHQGYARHTEGTEALPGGTGELKGDRSIREAGVPVRFSDHARHPGPDRAVGVADGRTQPDRPSLRSRRGDLANDLRVEVGVLGPVVAWGHVPAGPCPLRIGVAQDELEIHTRRFGVVSRLWPEQIHAADDFLDRPGAELGQDLTDLGGHGAQVGDDHLGRAAELRAQRLLLGGNAHRARIEVTLPGHHAPQRHDGGAAEAVLIRAQQGGDDDIATDLQSAINAEPHAPPQVVAHQHLLRLGQAQLPRHAGILDRVERRRAGSAVVPADLNRIGESFGHAGGDRPYAGLRHQLHRHTRAGMDAFQVVDQLRQVLDAVDVVMRGWRDQGDARLGPADPGDLRRDLVARQLSAFTRLASLRHLDLQLIRRQDVLRGDAKPRRGNLLDAAVGGRPVALRIFAAFAAVRARADPVGGGGQRLVRLPPQRAVRHGGDDEPPQDRLDRLHLLQRDRRLRDELDQITHGGGGSRRDQPDQRLARYGIAGTDRPVHGLHHVGVEGVVLAVTPEPHQPGFSQRFVRRGKCRAVTVQRLRRKLGEADPIEP